MEEIKYIIHLRSIGLDRFYKVSAKDYQTALHKAKEKARAEFNARLHCYRIEYGEDY